MGWGSVGQKEACGMLSWLKKRFTYAHLVIVDFKDLLYLLHEYQIGVFVVTNLRQYNGPVRVSE